MFLMGSPDGFLALVRRAFQLQTAPSGKVFRSLRGATKGAALGNQPFGHVGFASPNRPLRVPSGTRAAPGL